MISILDEALGLLFAVPPDTMPEAWHDAVQDVSEKYWELCSELVGQIQAELG
jgi:hypothetical protein